MRAFRRAAPSPVRRGLLNALRQAAPSRAYLHGLAGQLAADEGDALPLAFYAVCLFIEKTCALPPDDEACAEQDRACALTLLNEALIIPSDDAFLQLASPVSVLCRWALAHDEGAGLLTEVLCPLFARANLARRLSNTYEALNELLGVLNTHHTEGDAKACIEALQRCMDIEFRSARYGHMLSLRSYAH